jgi:hypothetical protein
MAAPSIRGHQGQVKLYRNGSLVNILTITNLDINQDSSFARSNYVGNPIPEGDQTIEGWSGSMDLEVKDAQADLLIDAIVNQNLNGVGLDDITVVSTEFYHNGTSQSYVYMDMQFKMSRNQKGLNDKITKRLDFQASFRKAL